MVPCCSAHEVAYVKPLFCHSFVLLGVNIGWPMKPLFCQTLALHGLLIVGPWNCPCITTVSPHIGITWASHLLAHDIAHVKTLFCHSLVSSGAHIGRPMNLPIHLCSKVIGFFLQCRKVVFTSKISICNLVSCIMRCFGMSRQNFMIFRSCVWYL